MTKQFVETPWISVVMNETLKGFFKGRRGLRHGDHLSPYLFILVEEILSRLLKRNFEKEKIKPFVLPRGTPLISNLLYADDIIVFANGGRASLKGINDTFNL